MLSQEKDALKWVTEKKVTRSFKGTGIRTKRGISATHIRTSQQKGEKQASNTQRDEDTCKSLPIKAAKERKNSSHRGTRKG